MLTIAEIDARGVRIALRSILRCARARGMFTCLPLPSCRTITLPVRNPFGALPSILTGTAGALVDVDITCSACQCLALARVLVDVVVRAHAIGISVDAGALEGIQQNGRVAVGVGARGTVATRDAGALVNVGITVATIEIEAFGQRAPAVAGAHAVREASCTNAGVVPHSHATVRCRVDACCTIAARTAGTLVDINVAVPIQHRARTSHCWQRRLAVSVRKPKLALASVVINRH